MTAQFEQLLHPPKWQLPATSMELFFRRKEGGKEEKEGGGEGRRERRWQGGREREREEREKKSTVGPYSHFPQQFGESSGLC